MKLEKKGIHVLAWVISIKQNENDHIMYCTKNTKRIRTNSELSLLEQILTVILAYSYLY